MQSPLGQRLVVTDYFSTPHVLEHALESLTGKEMTLLYTVCMISLSAARSDKILRQVFERVASLGRVKGKPLSFYSQSPEYSVTKNAGYIILKEGNTVKLHCNDLSSTSWPPVQRSSEYEMDAVHGLATSQRWIGGE